MSCVDNLSTFSVVDRNLKHAVVTWFDFICLFKLFLLLFFKLYISKYIAFKVFGHSRRLLRSRSLVALSFLRLATLVSTKVDLYIISVYLVLLTLHPSLDFLVYLLAIFLRGIPDDCCCFVMTRNMELESSECFTLKINNSGATGVNRMVRSIIRVHGILIIYD